MANRVEIILEATTNAFRAGIDRARDTLNNLGDNARTAGGTIADGMDRAREAAVNFGQAAGQRFRAVISVLTRVVRFTGVAATAIVTAAAATVRAYTEQEQAETDLSNALRQHGDGLDVLLPKLRDHARAIQDETGISDQATITSMARLAALGVEADKLEEAARMHIGLMNAGLSSEDALEATEHAIHGEADALRDLIPAIEDVTDDTEVLNRVNDMATTGYENQTNELNTVSGAWQELKSRLSDVWQEIGRVIVENTGLVGILNSVSDWVGRVTQRFVDWAGGGGIGRVINALQVFGVTATGEFRVMVASANTTADTVVQWFIWLWDQAVTYTTNGILRIQNAFGNMRDNISELFRAIWEGIRTGRVPSPDFTDLNAGFEGVEATAERPAEAWQRGMETIAEINRETQQELDQLAEDFAAREEQRAQEAQDRAEQVRDAEARLAQESADEQIAAIESVTEAAEQSAEDIENATEHAYDNMTEAQRAYYDLTGDWTTEGFRNYMRGIEEAEDATQSLLGELAQIGDTAIFRLNRTRANNILQFLQVLQNAPSIGDLGLGQFAEIGEISMRLNQTRARNILQFINALGAAQRVPDLNLGQFSALQDIPARDIIDLLDAMRNAAGANLSLEFEFTQQTLDIFTKIEENTRGTKENTDGLDTLLTLR